VDTVPVALLRFSTQPPIGIEPPDALYSSTNSSVAPAAP
jgi:hypothetical protein